VTDEEVRQRVTAIADSQGKQADELMKDIEGSDLLGRLKDDLWLEKVHEFLVGRSNVTTEQVEIPREGGDGGE
jgi:hypothetical protein